MSVFRSTQLGEMFGEQKAKKCSEIRENNVPKKSNEVKTNTWSVESLYVAHNVTRLLEKTDPQCMKHNGLLENLPSHIILPKLLSSFTMLSRNSFDLSYEVVISSRGVFIVLWSSRKLSKFAKKACGISFMTLRPWHWLHRKTLRFTTRNKKYGSSRNISKSSK